MFRRFFKRRTAANLPPIVNVSPVTGTLENRIFTDGQFLLSVLRFTVPDNWFVLGDYAQADNGSVTGSMLAIQVGDDDPDFPALAPPIRLVNSWTILTTSHANPLLAIFVPVAPFGYVACGAVAGTSTLPPPAIPNLRCVRYDLVTQVAMGPLIYNARPNSSDGNDPVLYRVPFLNTFWPALNQQVPPPNAFVPTACLPG